MAHSARHTVWILIVGGLVLFANLGGPRLWDRDEPRNAGCAVEMLQRGDWITPVFNGELRTHKPILLYWFMMVAYAAFGVSEFAARFWSAALGLGTALLTYGIGRRMFSSATGLWAAVILLTTLMFDVASRAATPDAFLIFWSTAALYVYVWGTFSGNSSDGRELPVDGKLAGHKPVRLFPTWPVAVLMYACMGMATLAKGPVGFVLPTAVIGMYLLVVREARRAPTRVKTGWGHAIGHWFLGVLRPFSPRHFLATCWMMRPLTAMFVILVVALPWYAAVGFRTDGAWLRGFFLEHNLGRAVHSLEGHRGPLVYYPMALLVGFFPWSVFAVPAALDTVRGLRHRGPDHAGRLLALSWVGVYLILFSIASTKLPSYITPCYPAVALLVGCFVQRWIMKQSAVASWWNRWAFATLALIGGIALIGIPVVTTSLMPGDQWLAVLGLIPIGTALGAWLLLRKQHRREAAVTFAVGAVLLMATVFGVAAPQVDRHRTFDRLLTRIDQLSARPCIGTLGTLEPSWVFYAGRPLDLLMPADVATTDPRARVLAARGSVSVPIRKTAIPVRAYLRQGPDHFVITTRRDVARLGPLPRNIKVLAETHAFLKKQQLVLLGWDSESSETIAWKQAATRR